MDFISHDVPGRSIRSPMRSVTRSSVRRPAALIVHMWIDLYKDKETINVPPLRPDVGLYPPGHGTGNGDGAQRNGLYSDPILADFLILKGMYLKDDLSLAPCVQS